MLPRDKVISIIKQSYPDLVAEFGIKRIGLFGSFADGVQTNKSDIDLIIEFNRPIGLRIVDLGERLEMLLGRKVDILTLTGVQGIRIPGVAESILKHVIYL